jgi:hypothetical protein
MTWNEVGSVLREGRLLSGWLFPSSDAERAPCGHGVFMERALFVAGAGGCGRRDWRREAWDFVDEAFLEGREALGLGGYFAGCRLCCGACATASLWGVVRMGATHRMFGRGRADSSTPTPSMCCGRGASSRGRGLGLFCWGVCLLSQVRRARGHGWRGSFLRGRVFGRFLWLCVLVVKWRRVYGRSVRYLI